MRALFGPAPISRSGLIGRGCGRGRKGRPGSKGIPPTSAAPARLPGRKVRGRPGKVGSGRTVQHGAAGARGWPSRRARGWRPRPRRATADAPTRPPASPWRPDPTWGLASPRSCSSSPLRGDAPFRRVGPTQGKARPRFVAARGLPVRARAPRPAVRLVPAHAARGARRSPHFAHEDAEAGVVCPRPSAGQGRPAGAGAGVGRASPRTGV